MVGWKEARIALIGSVSISYDRLLCGSNESQVVVAGVD
jgi:hypothetical protein